MSDIRCFNEDELKDWYENTLVPDANTILDPGMVQPTWEELSEAGLEDVQKMYCEYLKENK
jgi:hypothetical protein